jgi:uncharacterized membrane protein/mono/diheme cytochrome c family protein
MTTPGDPILRQFRFGFAMLAPILIVTAMVAFLPPDGNERADWLQFIGHFHPLVVHFPVALVLLAPILELAGRKERLAYLRLSVEFVLALATLGATAAAILGWCLGRSGGYSGSLITQHMWGGILLCIVCWLCWFLRVRDPEPGIVYAVALVFGVGLVAWTGYRGGQLSLGPNDLTEHMPKRLRSVLGVESGDHRLGDHRLASPADPNTFYGARVQPILAAHCISCHGADKQKGNLRLDDYRGLLRGGKDGPVILAGNAHGSELFRRITLPAGNDDFMPKGKQPLSAEQVKVIEAWIEAGASEKLALNAIKNVSPTTVATPQEVSFEEIDAAAVAALRSASAPAVTQLQKQFPNVLDYDSRASADLRLDASPLGSRFGDKELTAFTPIAEQITVLDLSRTAVTDRSASVIAAMRRLRVLRLADTTVTDATLLRLGSMDQLESLNLYGTSVTPAVLKTISNLPKLAHFYAGQTKIEPGKSIPESLAGKIVF